MKFEAEVISWLPQLRRYARALTGDSAWADDLVQDTAERALARWAAFRPNSNLRAWLLTILRHLYIDQLRARREIAVDDESAPWRNLEAPAGVVDGLVLRDLQRALYCLPLEQREVLLLVCVEELNLSGSVGRAQRAGWHGDVAFVACARAHACASDRRADP